QQLDTVTTFALEDFVYIKITAQLGGSLLNPQTTDTCVVRLTNLTTSEYIDVIFDRKIGSDTISADSTYYFIREGLKNIQLKYIGLTNNDNNYLGAYYGDTISVSVLGGFTNTKNFTIVTPTEPASLNSLYIMNSSYTERIAETVRFTQGDIVYLQATAQQDAQLLTQDSLLVTVKNSDGTLMTVELLETGKNTGIYRSSEIQITNLTNPNQKTIEEIFGDSVWFEAKGKSDTLYFVVPKVPQQIYNAKFYYGGFTNLMSSQSYQKPLNFYVQVVAQDSEPYYIDTLPVIVQRASSNADSIIVILTETAKSSGLFRSPLITIGDITNQNTLTLRGEYGETIGLRISNTIYDTFLLSPNTSVEPAALTAFTLMTANYGTILPDFYKIVKGDRIYLQATAQTDLQPLVADTFLVNVKLNGTLIMTITMLETSLNSGIFRNSDIVIADNTDSSLKTVAETFGAPLTFEAKGLTDTVYFALPTTPLVNLGNAKFYNTLFTQSYSQQKFDKPLNLAIEINATDLEPYYVDTLSVIVQRRNSSVDSIALILTETSKSSGKFRSENFTIDNYTSQIQKRLSADYNDTVGLVINGVLHDTILINNASGPNMLYEIYFTNSAFTVKLLDNERVDINERLYIEASGDYGNSNLIDTFSVFVRNNRTGDSVSIVLTETSRNSGIYRNSEILIKELTSQYLKYLKANYYDSISILSNYNVSDTIYVVSPSSPTTIYDAFFQNEQFTDILSGRRLPLNTKLNVSLFSEDLEIKYNDTNTIYIRNTVNGDSVFVQAREISSGILRTLNFVTLGDYTNNTLFTLRAAEGDTINLIINNRIYDTIYLVTNNSNIVATSFNFLYSLDTSAIRSD
ncbi:MAG TPA: hypothetical protein PLJ38_01710, partial [bacterium]|nr:hypothetical protein [bacterium]